jgi:hypothetical protein
MLNPIKETKIRSVQSRAILALTDFGTLLKSLNHFLNYAIGHTQLELLLHK